MKNLFFGGQHIKTKSSTKKTSGANKKTRGHFFGGDDADFHKTVTCHLGDEIGHFLEKLL